MTLPHSDILSQSGTSFATEQSILEVQYGDGYGQRASDGLNDMRKTGVLTWIPLTKSERDDIHTFWTLRGVVHTFQWAAPNDIERTWRFTDGLNESSSGDKYILSVPVKEEFE